MFKETRTPVTIVKVCLMVIIFFSFAGTSQRAWGQNENPALPPPSACVSCQSNNWMKVPMSYPYVCPDNSICTLWVDVLIPLGCGSCEIWIGDITEPTNCSCYGNMNWNDMVKGAVKIALTYYQQSWFQCSGNAVHVFTAGCLRRTDPITLPPFYPGGQPQTIQMIIPCGESCCENVYDFSTSPPTLVSSTVHGNNLDNCQPMWGPIKNNICYTMGCDDVVPYIKQKKEKETLTNK
ncbi:MAG: hypothetical protein IPP08_03375 [Chlorobiota bacterium]|jgi:hypothetical protein|nr:hypothetical protein [Chlorobiota bacterium]QQS67226.1 MAG: hypothetical protein IPP08_03375 [Chlorobiota bacterium]